MQQFQKKIVLRRCILAPRRRKGRGLAKSFQTVIIEQCLTSKVFMEVSKMRRIAVPVLVATLAISLTATRRAGGQPNSAPPEFGVVGQVDKAKNSITLLGTRSAMVPTFVDVTAERDGKKTTKREVVFQSRLEKFALPLSLHSFRVRNIAGKEYQGEELWKVLVPGKMILRQADTQPLDRAYFKIFLPDTLLLVPRDNETKAPGESKAPGGSVRAAPQPPKEPADFNKLVARSEKYLLKTLKGHRGLVWSVAFSSDGKSLASASRDGTVRIWDVASGQTITTLTGHKSVVFALAYSPDGKTLASGSWDNTIRIWDVATGKSTILTGHTQRISRLAFSPDGKTLASGSYDGTIKLCGLPGGVNLMTLRGHTAAAIYVAFDPAGKSLFSASVDGTVRQWDTASGSNLRNFNQPSQWTGAALSPNGKFMATAIRT